MELRYLEAFNIHSEIIRLWENKYGYSLLPIQELAVKQYRVLDGDSLLIFSPTSSGKTFVAEMAAVKHAREKKKVIFAVPLKSLAEEKFRQFQEVYAQFGIRTVIATRDRAEFDRAIEENHFEIAVMVYEKINALLIKHPSFLDRIGLMVIDELQMLGDESRGTDLDLLLTKIILQKEQTRGKKEEGGGKIQLLGLSAVLGDAENLARWLGVNLLVHSDRPVELRKGVLYNGVFQYQEHNSKTIGEEIFFVPESGSRGAIHHAGLSAKKKGLINQAPTSFRNDTLMFDDPYNTEQILSLVQYLAETKLESSIIFVPKKSLTRRWASSLAEKVTLLPATNALAAINQLEDSLVKDEMNQLLTRGIAYHNADLNAEFREIIETYFRNGEIRIIVATSTLGQGVNLAAKNAIIVPHTVKYLRPGKSITEELMSKAQFENSSGRVGRLGIESEFGRAILVAGNDNQRLSYWLWYIEQPFKKLDSHLPQEHIESLCLNLISSGWGKNSIELTRFISRMYRRFRVDSSNQLDDAELQNQIIKTVGLAQQWNLVATNARNELEPTASGRATAFAGITYDTARHFVQWLDQLGTRSFSELEVLLVCALSPDAVHFLFPFSQQEARTMRYRSELMNLIFESQEETRQLFMQLLNQHYPPAKEKLLAMKKTLVLYHWVNEVPTPELERGYRAYFGAIANLAAEFAWLVQALAGLAQSFELPDTALQRLAGLGERLRYGVNEQALPLMRLNIPGLGRMRVSRLVREGYATPEAVAELELDTLAKLVSKPVAERLKQKLSSGVQLPHNAGDSGVELPHNAGDSGVELPHNAGDSGVQLPHNHREYRSSCDGANLRNQTEPAQNIPEYDTMHLLGIPLKKRTLLKINHQEIGLRNREYLILLKLALANRNGNEPWQHRDELDAPDNFGRSISRLRCVLRKYQKNKKTAMIDNDQQGYYRLNLPPENVVIEFDNFNQHWNREFQEIINKSKRQD